MGDTSDLELTWRTVMISMACLPLLICAVILLFRKIERSPSIYLALFLLAIILAVGPQIIGYAGFYDKWPGLTFFPLFSTELLLGPLIYLHADRLMRGGALGWRKFLLAPGILQLIYYTIIYFRWDNHLDKWAYNGKYHAPYILPVENILTVAFMIVALIAIWRLIKTYRAHLDATSSAAMDYDPIWLRNLIVALVISSLIFGGLEIADTFMRVSYNAAFPFQVLAILVIAWIAIEAVWRLNHNFPKLSGQKDNPNPTLDTRTQDCAINGEKLREKVIAENWHLEPRLSIRQVAARMGTNETYISRALNQGLGKSFNTFINGLRVDHAKSLIQSNDGSFLNIAFDSGFNSKATFNRVFRQQTGQTPTQFKKSQNP